MEMRTEDASEEEEVLVYVEFKDNVNIEKYRNIHILGIDSKDPIVQMDDTFYIGKYENPFGTYMFFEEDPSPNTEDSLFDRLSEKNLKYFCKSRKYIQMQHAYVSPKEGEDYEPGSQSDLLDEDIKAVNFKTVQEAVNTFKTEMRNKTTETSGKKKKRINLEKCFQDINRNHVRIKIQEKKTNNQVLFAVLAQLLNVMKTQNPLFRHFKPKLEFLGSYFDRVRVKSPSEYDINLILTIPINYRKVTLEADKSQAGYTFIKLPSEFRRLSKTPEAAEKGFTDTILWCDKSHRLSVKKIRAWMESVVDVAINSISKLNEGSAVWTSKFSIQHKQSGPANTITLKNNEQVIDIDLVPSISFILPKVPRHSKINFEKVSKTKIQQYFAVPKPSSDDYSWRLAFPLQERSFLYNKQNLRSVLKLIKLLRDVQNLKQLSSYYIKTVFLWESSRKDDEFWKSNTLEFLTLHMLKKLNESLSTGRISNFWCEQHNLLENVKSETLRTWQNKISVIILNIERNRHVNPEVVYTYFTENIDDKKIKEMDIIDGRNQNCRNLINSNLQQTIKTI